LKRFFFLVGLLGLLSGEPSFSQSAERLSLDETIAIALQNNPDALASAEHINIERGRFWRGVSLPPPSLAVNYEYIPRGGNVRQFGERTLELSQSFDFPTTMILRGSRLSSAIAIAEGEHAVTTQALRLQATTAYYDVLLKEKKIELTREIFAIADEFARTAEVRYRVGDATNLERLTAAVQRTQAQNNILTAESELDMSMAELYRLLGRNKDAHAAALVLTDSLTYRPVTETLERITERAFSANPELAAAGERVTAQKLDRSLAWSGWLPTVNASYFRQTVGGSPDFYGISLGISLPVWFFFDQKGQIQEAAAGVRTAEYELQSSRNTMIVNIRNAYRDMENNAREINLHRTEILPQAEEMYRIARASYETGEITYIEFIQARQLVVSVRNEYVEELARYCISCAKLEYAVGSSIH
jgi:outer membrane protein TolC